MTFSNNRSAHSAGSIAEPRSVGENYSVSFKRKKNKDFLFGIPKVGSKGSDA